MFLDIYAGFLIFIFGLLMGSFYNVCIYRIPEEISVVKPSSRCPFCEHKLTYLDMIPVLSHIFLKGRCRYCGEKISWRYSLVELLTASLFLLSFRETGLSPELGFFLVFVSFMIIITFIDIDHRIIPDRFAVAGIIMALAYLFFPLVFHGDYSGPLFSGITDIGSLSDIPLMNAVTGGVIGGGVLLFIDLSGRVILKKEAMGFGDVKLMTWTGFFLGMSATILALLLAVWAGAFLGVIILLSRKRRKIEDKYMPFGPFLTLGSVISLFFSGNIIPWYLSTL